MLFCFPRNRSGKRVRQKPRWSFSDMSRLDGTDSGKWTMAAATSSERVQLEAHSSSSDGGPDWKPLPRDGEPDSKLLPQDDGSNPNPLTEAVVSDPVHVVSFVMLERVQLEAHSSSSDGGPDWKPLPRDGEPDSKLLPQDDGSNPNPLTEAIVSDPVPRVQDVESDPKLLPQDETSDSRNPLPQCAELEPKLLPEDVGSEPYHLAQDVAALLHDVTSDLNPLPQVIYRCKKCRQIVASEENVVPHEHGKGEECFKYMRGKKRGENHETPPECTSVFVDPLKWMQPVQEGYLYEKLYCMGCKSRLGAFNWCGMQCSCGAWVNPAFQLHKSRIDECRI